MGRAGFYSQPARLWHLPGPEEWDSIPASSVMASEEFVKKDGHPFGCPSYSGLVSLAAIAAIAITVLVITALTHNGHRLDFNEPSQG